MTTSSNGLPTTLTPIVRLQLEGAKDQAQRNIDYLSRQIAKSEAEIIRHQTAIKNNQAELAENRKTLAQAEGLLDAS